MSRKETQVMVFEWGKPETKKARDLVRDLPRGMWLDVHYGYDRACGFYLQAKPAGADEWTIDYDSLFDGLSGGEMLHLFGVLRLPVPSEVAASLAMDLGF